MGTRVGVGVVVGLSVAVGSGVVVAVGSGEGVAVGGGRVLVAEGAAVGVLEGVATGGATVITAIAGGCGRQAVSARLMRSRAKAMLAFI